MRTLFPWMLLAVIAVLWGCAEYTDVFGDDDSAASDDDDDATAGDDDDDATAGDDDDVTADDDDSGSAGDDDDSASANDPCAPQDAAEGPDTCDGGGTGYRWTGEDCVYQGDLCNCIGEDCGNLFDTQEECLAAYADCL